MGFFSKLFSKQTCSFCDNQVGALSRKKLKDGNYICKECEKNCSAFIDPCMFDIEYMKQHMEYMKKQDVLYKKEFEVLDKKQKDRIVHEGYHGIVFADDIAMFEVVHPKASKKNYKELFRYDQIVDYDIYTVNSTSTEEDAKKYAEVGVTIDIRCAIGDEALGEKDVDNKRMFHPYVKEFKILCARNDDYTFSTNLIISHLDKIFCKKSSTVAGSIKESMFGTTKERQSIKMAADAVKGLGSLAKAGITGSEEDRENAKVAMQTVAEDGLNLAFNNMGKYQELANQAEQRAWAE
ncbi:MAG: hypothetical protein E7262_09885 [Lachnospiraceae bacterium]|nr:hypothetical protein [Lachnospiraceae bacterium]